MDMSLIQGVQKIGTHVAVGDELTYSVCKHPCDRKDRAPDIQGQDILNPGRPNLGVERNGKTKVLAISISF